MKHVEKMMELINFLEGVRKKYKMCTINDIADSAGVTRQTVYNTLMADREPNAYVVMAYISKILWELEHNYFKLALDAGVQEEEAIADRQNLILMMSMM